MSDGADPSFAGKVAMVAGGYGGIGEAVARELTQRGATVVIGGRDQGRADALAAALRASGGDASGVAFDARDVASIRAAVDAAARRHGAIDHLVNSVGTQQIEPLVDVTEEAFDRVLDCKHRGRRRALRIDHRRPSARTQRATEQPRSGI